MKNYHIGIEVTMEIISGKWKPLLLCYIQTGINRNGQFLKVIPEISQKVLSEQLRQLEQDGIISRHVFAEVPPHVEYELTEQGQSLTHVLMELCNWGEGHLQDLQAMGTPVKLEQKLKQL
ncbi:helix-turn-helix domain-containing protein [Pediococcus argentinicus]